MLDSSIEIEPFVGVGTELFKKLLFKYYESVPYFDKDKVKEYELFGNAINHYVGSIIRRYNYVQILGMREPVPLKSLYVRANILEKISRRSGLLANELDDFFDFDRRAFGEKQETVDGEIIINKLRKFIVLGKPGAGKTTYLKYLTLMMLDPYSQIKQRKLPVFVTLREWADTRLNLMDFIIQQFDTCNFTESEIFLKKIFREDQCLILFDGLDSDSRFRLLFN